MGKKKSGAAKQDGFETVKGKKEPPPSPKDDGFEQVGKKGKKGGNDEGFETVVGKKAKEASAQKKKATAAANAVEIYRREVPLHKDQVRGALQKIAGIRDDTNTILTHKDAPFPGNPSTMVIEGTELGTMRAEALLLKVLKEVKHEEAIPTSRNGEPMIGVIIGPKGQTMEKLRELAPQAKIQLPEEGGHKVTVYGPAPAVQKVAAAIRQLSGANVDASQISINTEEIEIKRKVPRDSRGKAMHWLLIGKGGANASRIREETGAQLSVPPPHSPSDEYTLRGTLEACEAASKIIFELLADHGETFSMEEVTEEPEKPKGPASWLTPDGKLHVPSVSGAKTCVAPRLQKTGSVNPVARAPVAPVAAAPKAAAKAPAEPMDLGELYLMDIPLPRSAASAKVKTQIKELALENNVKVTIEGNDSIRLDGYYRRVLFAERAMLQLMGMTKAEVPIPTSRSGDPMVGLVIGPGGKTINAIRAQSGAAFVLMPDDACGLAWDSVTIFGSPAEVDHAVNVVRTTLKISEEATRKITADPNSMEIEVDVPKDRQGNALTNVLIGAGGKNVKWIREESDGCEIDIPKRGFQGAELKYKLRGTEAQIKAAQNCIRMLFDELDTQVMYGDPSDHCVAPNPYPADAIVIGGR